MPYALLADLTERAGEAEIRQIADHDRNGTADPLVIAAALADTDNKIDGYVSTRNVLPLASVPELVRTWAVSIARYILHRNGAPEHVAQDCKDAIQALKDLAAGRINLPAAAGLTAPAAQSGQVLASHPPRVFTPGRLQGWP